MKSTVLSRREMLGASVAGVSTLVFLEGCTTGNITEAVNAVVVAANLALGILEATGTIPPNILMLVQPYLAGVGQAVIDTNTELQTMDTDAVKATKIAAIWANFANGVALPAGTPPIVGTVIAEVVAAIRALLAIIQPATSLALPVAGRNAGSRYQLTRGDRHVLGQLTQKGADIKKRALALH